MAEEDKGIGGIWGGVTKLLNDARYIPAVLAIIFFGLVLFGPNKVLAEPGRRIPLAFLGYAWWAGTVGWIHTYLAWRLIKTEGQRARHTVIEFLKKQTTGETPLLLNENQKSLLEHELAMAEQATLSRRDFSFVALAYAIGFVVALLIALYG